MRRFATLVVSAICACGALVGQQTSSSIVLPIEFDLASFVADAERELPKEMHSEWEAVGKTVVMPVAYRFDLERTPVEVTGRGSRVTISTQIRYKVDVGVPGPTSRSLMGWRRINGCQPTRPVTVSLETRIDLTPDWLLRGRSQPKLEMLEPCRLTAARELVNVDISEKVRLAFADGLNKAAREFDRRLAGQVVLRDLAARAWTAMAEPVPLGDRTWLKLNPTRALVMRPAVSGRTVRTGVVVTGTPELLTAPAEAAPVPPLPTLELTDLVEGFTLDWMTTMTWSEVAARMRETMVGEEIKVAGRRTVRIEAIDVRPEPFAGGTAPGTVPGPVAGTVANAVERVIITADVTGGVKGKIQLTGRPQFDPATRTLEFADLDFTIDTRSFLIRVADWFRHESTRRKLAAKARLDVGKWLEESRGRIEKGLREKFGQELRLEGSLVVGEPFVLAYNMETVNLTARVTGSLVLRWQGR